MHHVCTTGEVQEIAASFALEPIFQLVVTPVGAVLVSVGGRQLSRRELGMPNLLEDAVVGLDLIVASLLLGVAELINIARADREAAFAGNRPLAGIHQISSQLGLSADATTRAALLVLCAFCSWVLVTWIMRVAGRSEDDEVRFFAGMLVPNIIGSAVLALVIALSASWVNT